MVTVADPRQRIERLTASAESRIRRAFLDIVRTVRNEQSLEAIANLLEAGRVQEAVEAAGTAMGERLSMVTGRMFELSADGVSNFFLESVGVVVDYNRTNERAVRFLRNDRLRLIRELMDDTRAAVRQALVRGTEAGLNPRAQARLFRESLGLTARQEAAVANYRRLLEVGNAEALTRELRDRRFDSRVRRAVEGVERFEPLDREAIERMTERYRERYIRYRSEVIARTESLRSVHAGADEMMAQAIESGKFDQDQIEEEWHTSIDGRERASHRAMDGQTRPWGRPFTSGAGYSLRYPGDPNAPASETIQCRCVKTRRIKNIDRSRAPAATIGAAQTASG